MGHEVKKQQSLFYTAVDCGKQNRLIEIFVTFSWLFFFGLLLRKLSGECVYKCKIMIFYKIFLIVDVRRANFSIWI